ncbi:MAG: BMP family ABC transporter substrate-binding protein [Alkalibacterium sp.]|nr:BMP family ABC transporter substrate-binding protein [Alkalibacterium sp.]
MHQILQLKIQQLKKKIQEQMPVKTLVKKQKLSISQLQWLPMKVAVDDCSFNQSAWEGMQAWGEEHGVSEGEGYDYYQSNDSAEYVPNLNQALAEGYDIIYGIGYQLLDSVNDVADQNREQNFGIVDDISDRENVVSLTFADHEAAFLAGVAAAETTETGQSRIHRRDTRSSYRPFPDWI